MYVSSELSNTRLRSRTYESFLLAEEGRDGALQTLSVRARSVIAFRPTGYSSSLPCSTRAVFSLHKNDEIREGWGARAAGAGFNFLPSSSVSGSRSFTALTGLSFVL